jgi:hypothetical protein
MEKKQLSEQCSTSMILKMWAAMEANNNNTSNGFHTI